MLQKWGNRSIALQKSQHKYIGIAGKYRRNKRKQLCIDPSASEMGINWGFHKRPTPLQKYFFDIFVLFQTTETNLVWFSLETSNTVVKTFSRVDVTRHSSLHAWYNGGLTTRSTCVWFQVPPENVYAASRCLASVKFHVYSSSFWSF